VTTTRTTDVAIVGGGILGCSAALHLRLFGCDSVALIERDQVGSGTSSAGAGLVARWSAGFVPAWGAEELELETYGLNFYRDLAACGHELGYSQNGTLFLGLPGSTGTKCLLPFARQTEARGLALLTPREVEALTRGFVRAAGVAGGIFDPYGAQVAAGSAARALAGRFAELGGVIIEHESVKAIRRPRTGGFVLETATGLIKCKRLVAAAGGWMNSILQQLGMWIPLVPLVATRVVTQPLRVPPSLPAIQFCDGHRIYLRRDQGSVAWGCNYEGHLRYAFVARALPERLDGLSLDCVADMQRVAEEIGPAVPALAGARAASAVHGAPCFTADLKPVVGELAAVPGLYVLGGDNYAGVTLAPGAGRLLAELVTCADPSINASPYSPARFNGEYRKGADVVAGMRWTATRTVLAARAGLS
jgi:glycine/D-amino acid oxidase-like deaminating enzyme